MSLVVDARGNVVAPGDEPRAHRALYAARYRYRPVRCGKKSCKSCPHYWYAYRHWRADGAARETYLGPAEEQGPTYELPELRARRRSFGLE